MAVSKNNPNARKAVIQKTFKGKPVKPVMYIGVHGKYIGAQDDSGSIVLDEKKIPIPFRKLDQFI